MLPASSGVWSLGLPDAEPQHDHAVRLDLSYRLTFAVPSFEVASRLVDLAGRFHAALSPAFPLDASGIAALPGTTFGEVGLEGRTAFGDSRFAIRPTGFEVDIRNLQTSDSRDYAERFVGTCRTVLDEVVPRADGDTCTISAALWLKLRDGVPRARELLEAQRPAVADVLRARGRRVLTGLDLRAFADDQGYESEFRCEPSVSPGADLFLLLTWKARGEMAQAELRSQATSVETELRMLAGAIGLELTP
jgi:hypothetical protein